MLQKQTITIPLGLGINTKADDKLVQAGEFNLLTENATFDKVGAVKKRTAYEAMSNKLYQRLDSAGTNTNYNSDTYPPTGAFCLGSQVLLRESTGKYFYSHDGCFVRPAIRPAAAIGQPTPVYPQDVPEVKISGEFIYTPDNDVDYLDTDYDSTEGVLIASCLQTPSNIGFGSAVLLIYDYENKTTVTCFAKNAGVGTGRGFVRCGWTRVASVSYYYLIYVNTDNDLIIDVFNKYGQSITSLTADTAMLGADAITMANNGPLSVCRSTDGTKFFIIGATTTATSGKFVSVSASAISTNTAFTYTGTGFWSASAHNDVNTNHIYWAYVTSTGAIKYIVFDYTAGIITANAVWGGWSADASAKGLIAWSQETTGVLHFVNNAFEIETSTIASHDPVARLSYLISDEFTLEGVSQVISGYLNSNEDQVTYFSQGSLAETTTNVNRVYSRFEDANGALSFSQVTRAAKIDLNTAAFVVKSAFQSGTSPGYFKFGIKLINYEVKQDYTSNSRAQIGPNLYAQGGFLSEFDGEILTENGFHIPPEISSLVIGSLGVLTGTYNYQVCFAYYDKNGQVTRSAPSRMIPIVTTADSVDISIRISPFGVKANKTTVEIYRTVANGTTLQLLYTSDVNMKTHSGSSFTFNDNLADSTLSGRPIIYTAGDVLQNDPAPSCKYVFQGTNRLYLVGLEDENEIAYSKKKLYGEPANFSDFFRIRFDTSQYNISGGVIAGACLEGKLVFFKKNACFYILGDGPNELGLNDTFTTPELISSESGCIEPRSVVATPEGIFCKGSKGIYLVDRSLSMIYIGANVEAYNQYNITSAVHIEKKNQVKFTLVDQEDFTTKYMLAYDYYTKQWSVDSGIVAIDGDVLDGNHLVLNAESNIPAFQGDTFIEFGSGYSQKVETPWIKVSGIQDFGRAWKAFILGKYKSAHQLIVKAYYDYDESYVETFTISPSVSDTQYQYECHLRKQKCEAVKFEIYDSSITGESMELTALTLEVGVRKGGMKLPATRKH